MIATKAKNWSWTAALYLGCWAQPLTCCIFYGKIIGFNYQLIGNEPNLKRDEPTGGIEDGDIQVRFKMGPKNGGRKLSP